MKWESAKINPASMYQLVSKNEWSSKEAPSSIFQIVDHTIFFDATKFDADHLKKARLDFEEIQRILTSYSQSGS